MTVARRILMVALPVVLTLVGYALGPALARLNSRVVLADEVRAEVDTDPAARSNEAKAFYSSGETRKGLLAWADEMVRRFRTGGAMLGAWCGLAAAMRLRSAARVRRRQEYEINHAVCVACGRCFMHCPMERQRRKELRQGADVQTAREKNEAA